MVDDTPDWMKFIQKKDFIYGLTIIALAERKFGVKYDGLSPTKWVKPISINKSKKIMEYCEKLVEKWKQEQSPSSKENHYQKP